MGPVDTVHLAAVDHSSPCSVVAGSSLHLGEDSRRTVDPAGDTAGYTRAWGPMGLAQRNRKEVRRC